MKVFIAGGTGAVGKRLVPLLASAGHDVYATTRSAGKVDDLRRLGAEPVVLDILDREAVEAAIAAARPEVIVHQGRPCLTSATSASSRRSSRRPTV